jgi:hypothetical protein
MVNEQTGKANMDYECDITSLFFEIETLGRLGARAFDNCGKTSVKGNSDGINIVGLINEKADEIHSLLEGQLELIDAEDK